MTNKNIALVERMYQLFHEKNDVLIRELFLENVQWNQMEGFPGGGKYRGIDEVLEFIFSGFRNDWTDWHAQTERFIDGGNSVFAIGYYSGTYRSTNRSVRAAFIGEYVIEAGKIAAFHQYTDTYLIARAMAAV